MRNAIFPAAAIAGLAAALLATAPAAAQGQHRRGACCAALAAANEADWAQRPPYYRETDYGYWPFYAGFGVPYGQTYWGDGNPPAPPPGRCVQMRRVWNQYFWRTRPVNVCSNYYRYYNRHDAAVPPPPVW